MAKIIIRKGALDGLRKQAGLTTQTEFAEHLRVDRHTLNRARKNHKASDMLVAAVLLRFPTKFEDVFEVTDAA